MGIGTRFDLQNKPFKVIDVRQRRTRHIEHHLNNRYYQTSMTSAATLPFDIDGLAQDPPLVTTSSRTPSPASSTGEDICLICLESLTPQTTPTSSTSSLSEPLLPVTTTANDSNQPTLLAIATQPPTAKCGCKYRVHPMCLQTWFAHQPVCPLCRTEVNTGESSANGVHTPNTEQGTPTLRTTRTVIIRQVSSSSLQGNLSDQDVMEQEKCSFCQRLACVLLSICMVYVIMSVCSIPNDTWPNVVNGTAL